jgi:glycosyltransferase involved in cell wall biosynthesis
MVSPLKPFEAMAMEKAVVASNVAALAEIVQDGVTGLLHVKGDAQDLAAKLAHLIDDAGERARLAAAGRRWVLAERRWSDLGRRVGDVYAQLSRPSA